MALNPLAAAATAAVVLYLYRLNKAFATVPKEALAYSPHRWTDDEIRETYERVCREPVDFSTLLPPKLGRRYIVVGGSGLVGGDIVMHLLVRGESPSAIRIVDFTPPSRPELVQVDFVKTDISDASAVKAAFTRPWPSSEVTKLPLTVFHTAAAIRPGERSLLVWDRTAAVNINGTQNCLSEARGAGADAFVFCSSVSVALRPCGFLIPPWAAHPRRWFQILDESDFDAPVRPHADYFSNYAYSKALAERIVGEANAPGFRTGSIRPGNGIYGMPRDLVFQSTLSKDRDISLCPTAIQNAVSAWNVSLAHLCFEAALARPQDREEMPACAGRPFVITDNGAPPSWQDFFRAVALVAARPPVVMAPPPLPFFLLAVLNEQWSLLLARFPSLTSRFGLRESTGDFRHLQPAVFSPQCNVACVDARARRSVAEGGIGYAGGLSTLEGACEIIRDMNSLREKKGGGGEKGEGTGGLAALDADLTLKAAAA